MLIDKPRKKDGFTGIAQDEDQSSPEVPVTQQIGQNGCNHHPDCDWPPRLGPKGDKHSG
jgi:hypothetical protein